MFSSASASQHSSGAKRLDPGVTVSLEDQKDGGAGDGRRDRPPAAGRGGSGRKRSVQDRLRPRSPTHNVVAYAPPPPTRPSREAHGEAPSPTAADASASS